MKYNATIENADSFTSVLMTQNGYPVYDIMVPSTPGYCRASGIAFYVEDDNILKEFEELETEERKLFLISNPEYIKPVQDIFKYSPEMRHPMPLAYNHLLYDFERTIKLGHYGCTHLIDEGKLLIFHQNEVFLKAGYKINSQKDFNELNDEIEALVFKQYKEGSITPDGEVSNKALERLKAKNPVIFKEMTEYQAKTLEVLKSFKNELLESCRLTYDKEEYLVIHMEINKNIYDINVTKESKEMLSYSSNGKKEEFKNVHDLIVSLYGAISNNKLNNFIKKAKI